MKTNKNKEIKKEQKTADFIKICIALFFIVSVMVKFEAVFFVSPKPFIPLASSGGHVDFFNVFKLKAGVVILSIMVVMFIYYVNKRKIQLSTIDLFASMVLLLAIVSSFLSEYTYISLWGTYERLTGTVFLILIFSLFFIVSKMDHTEKDIRKYYFLIGIFVVVNFLYSFLYTLGVDLLSNETYQKLTLVPEQYREMAKGYVVGTLENPNYLSGFASFLFFVVTIKYLFAEKYSFYLGFVSIFIIAIMIFSYSSSGIFAIFLTLPFAFYYLYKGREFINKKIFLHKVLILAGSIISLIAFSSSKSTRIGNELSSFVSTFGRFFWYYFAYFFGMVLFLILLNNKKIREKLWRYRLFIFGLFAICIIALFFIFPTSPDYMQHPPERMYNSEEIVDKIENKDYSSLFSKREYIWWYTFDLAREKPILGYGMTTLIFEYPQTSPLKIEKVGSTIVSKPHNHYLEILYGAGIFALVSFILFFLNIFILFIYKTNYTFDSLNIAIFLGMMAFLFQGLVNDMEVGSYPIVFIMLGVLVSRLNEIKTEIGVEEDVKKTTKSRRN